MTATKQTPKANAAAREAVIAEYLKALKLPAFAAEYPGLVRQSREGGWDYEDFLRELLEMELRSREERTTKRRLKEARFPDVNSRAARLGCAQGRLPAEDHGIGHLRVPGGLC